MSINMFDMKKSNVQTVLWALCSCRTSTIKDLAQTTGLSFATVGNILNNFVESGEAMLGEQVSTTGGRPSQAYTFNAEYAHVLALSAQVRNGENIIHACIGNLYGEIVWQTERCFDSIQLVTFDELIDSSLQAYSTIRILSFSLPGVERDGVILANDYKELEGVSFSDHFQCRYQMPVIVENDVNIAVFGYGRNISSASVIVGIYFPKFYNPGAGIMIDGKILKGACGYAGEFACLPFGIDWLSIDYENPREAGPAITKVISTFSGIVNPSHIVLYGDFFTEDLKETIRQIIHTQDTRGIFPSITYKRNLNSDIMSGLIIQAISVYQSGLRMK